jgi:hypothetical protein
VSRIPVVDPEDLLGVRGHDRADPVPVGPQDRQHVGEVLLALGVVGGQPAQRRAQQCRVEGVHPAVDLGDG